MSEFSSESKRRVYCRVFSLSSKVVTSAHTAVELTRIYPGKDSTPDDLEQLEWLLQLIYEDGKWREPQPQERPVGGIEAPVGSNALIQGCFIVRTEA